MSTREEGAPSPRVRSRDDLVRWIAAGEKPKPQWRIGTEHEKFVFQTGTLAPVPYAGPSGIQALMEEMIRRYGWIAIRENGNVIALKRPDGEKGGAISLEPGGQFELSGAAVETLHETADETQTHLVSPRCWRRPANRISRCWIFAEVAVGRRANHAEAALSGDDALHADGRQPRPRYDVSHRDRAGEPRLLE
jgi:Glutamate-cysteine ligase family 2(GCS2)